jgi:hypothetical protein
MNNTVKKSMSLQFSVGIVTHKSSVLVDANVLVNNSTNCLDITYITFDEIRYLKSIPIDLDVIDIYNISMFLDRSELDTFGSCNAVLRITGVIQDHKVIKKLRSGKKFYNRDLFFLILEHHLVFEYSSNTFKINYDDSSKNFKILESYKGNWYPFYEYQQKVISWILDIEMDILNKNNDFYCPTENTIRTSGISYNLHKKTISFLRHNDTRFLIYNSFKGCSVILEESLGKSTISAGLLGLTSGNSAVNFGQIIDESYIISKANLVICDLLDIPVYTKVLTSIDKDINIKIIKNEKDYKAMTYMDLISCDIVIITFYFFSILRNESDLLGGYGSEKNSNQNWFYSDLIKDCNIFEKTKPELSLIKFQRLILDDCGDVSRIITKVKALQYNFIVIFTTQESNIYPGFLFEINSKYNKRFISNLIRQDETRDLIFQETKCSLANNLEIYYTLSKKEQILFSLYKAEFRCLSINNFLISPKSFCEYNSIKTLVTTEQKAKEILENAGKYIQGSIGNTSGFPQDCPICFKEKFDEKIITMCGHIFCPDCMTKSLVSKRNCPICRALIEDNSYFYTVLDDNESFSSKIDKIINLLDNESFSNKKSLIYCENKYISFSISEALKEHRIKHFDSNTLKKKSSLAIKNFLEYPDGGILLVTKDNFYGKYFLGCIDIVIVVDPSKDHDICLESIIRRAQPVTRRNPLTVINLVLQEQQTNTL